VRMSLPEAHGRAPQPVIGVVNGTFRLNSYSQDPVDAC
jgi:hypothetical protein